MYSKVFTIKLNKEKCEQIRQSLENLQAIHLTCQMSAQISESKDTILLGKRSKTKLYHISKSTILNSEKK